MVWNAGSRRTPTPQLGPNDKIYVFSDKQYLIKDVPKFVNSARDKISLLVQQHLQTLSRKRMAQVKADAYGVVDGKAWNAEVQHFLDKVIIPALTIEETIVCRDIRNQLMAELVEEPARQECKRIEASYVYSEQMLPLEYERFCASRLESTGWICELTKGSGDQGADVIARKSGRVLVVQCKMYSSPIGNAAVQEVVAARGHLRADYCAVVSNASYTRSAIELATSNRTLLLHHSELDIVDARLKSL